MVRLECPLCGALVSEGPAPSPGTCPGCAARFDGGAEGPEQASALALGALGIAGDPERLTRGLFDARHDGVAITSDQRDGYYAWWVFVADTDEARAQVAALASG